MKAVSVAIGDAGDKLKDGEIPQVPKNHLKPEPGQWGPFWFSLPSDKWTSYLIA